ncbi:MAG: hypothetical protein JW818_12555 [Pirellulales bacterium]|nr:hypothetical protein [Pirellulales bacterium]
MTNRRRLTFSLATLMLLVVIVAQGISQYVMMRELAAARAEVEEIRRKYGHIRVEDEQKVYIASITENENVGTAYRLRIPPGCHYMLNLADTTFPANGYLEDPRPTKTLSMNTWKKGADVVLSYMIYNDGKKQKVRVWTETATLFDYHLKNWVDSVGPSEGSSLEAIPQKAFSPNETIRLMSWKNPETRRGVILWMEPLAAWEARRSRK